jgi:histidine ammonia-lyase
MSLIRKRCPALEDDRILSGDIAAVTALVHDSDQLSIVDGVDPVRMDSSR